VRQRGGAKNHPQHPLICSNAPDMTDAAIPFSSACQFLVVCPPIACVVQSFYAGFRLHYQRLQRKHGRQKRTHSSAPTCSMLPPSRIILRQVSHEARSLGITLTLRPGSRQSALTLHPIRDGLAAHHAGQVGRHADNVKHCCCTAASHMAGLGIPRCSCRRSLIAWEQGLTAVHDRHGYDSEKREALKRLIDRTIRCDR
jgi:hypothetical protein